jgi:transposase
MQVTLVVGIDVGKQEVMVASSDGVFTPRKVANQHAPLRAWLKSLPAGTLIGIEATGGYHETAAELAHSMGFVVFVLNPRDVNHYAKGLGQRGKTDRLDARIIARYVDKERDRLHPFVPLTLDEKALCNLQRRRATLVKAKSMLQQSLVGLKGLGDDAKVLLKAMTKLVDRMEQRMNELASRSAERSRLVGQLQTIDGVGPLTSLDMATLFTRVPLQRSDAVVAFYGIDPRPKDSGQMHGRRRLSKRGPAEGRRLLFNAAKSAINTTTWKPYYQHLRSKGFAGTEAIIIIARRIVRIAFAMFKHGTTFDPKMVPKPLT